MLERADMGQETRTAHAKAIHEGIRIETLTVLWMVVEGAVAIATGVIAGSLLLTAFGLDSVIELASGGILLWRLMLEARHGDAKLGEWAEHRAAWVVAIALALLCVYVFGSAVFGLITHARPDSSLIGAAVAMAAVVVMPWLGIVKRRLAAQLGSGALRGDADSSFTCGYMAATVLVGLTVNMFFHWWWAEYVAALVFLIWLVGETREALEEARGRDEDDDD